jgi:hypothetical protein
LPKANLSDQPKNPHGETLRLRILRPPLFEHGHPRQQPQLERLSAPSAMQLVVHRRGRGYFQEFVMVHRETAI